MILYDDSGPINGFIASCPVKGKCFHLRRSLNKEQSCKISLNRYVEIGNEGQITSFGFDTALL